MIPRIISGFSLTMLTFESIVQDKTGKHIGVCGEAAGDPLLALVLVGLGVSSLSMAPKKVNAVRAALRLHDMSTCQQMAAYALDSWTAEDAREAALKVADPIMADLL